jgi:beta-lactamase class A
MDPMASRRLFLLGGGCALVDACAPSPPAVSAAGGPDAARALSEIENKLGGRVGVFALDTGTLREIAYRADERFAMCSTFKWVLAASILAAVDAGQLSLADYLPYGSSDLLEHAPVTREHVAEGSLSVEALAQAAVTVSDNTTVNLLLARIGGPAAVTQFCRTHGDTVTRLDRNEPSLNTNEPGDLRDTTSPRSMLGLLNRTLCGDALSEPGRERLLVWLRASETGKARLRAGLPQSWTVGDKTGTGARGAANDVAVAVPPGRAPILIAAYLSDGSSG